MKKLSILLPFLLFSTLIFAQPANDNCTNAQTVPTNGSCVSGTTVGANDSWISTVGCQSNGNNHPDVWYTFTATGSQAQFTITGSGSWTGNVELILAEGDCNTGLSIIGNQCGSSPLITTINGLQTGVVYYYTISNSHTGTPGPFQTCLRTVSPPTIAGQDCNNAAILCNSNSFSQATSSAGFGTQEVSPANSCFQGGGERQSKWFKFTAGCTGTLEFNILPVVLTDDYDWAIWDITGNPMSCSTKGSAIACNWSGCLGSTGLSSCRQSEAGANNTGQGCTGSYAAWANFTALNYQPIQVIAGNTYALLVDNYSASNSGFSLTFGGACNGGTAKIGPDASFTAVTPICGTYNFTKTCSTTNSTYLWQFGDGQTSTLQNPSHTYSSSGSFIVTLQVTDALGCMVTSSQTVNINLISTPTATPTQPTCTVATGTITVNTPAPAAGISYSIDGVTYTNTTGVFANLIPGTYQVTARNSSGCVSTATPITINTPPPVPATPTATPTQPTCTVATGTITVNTPAPAAGISYSIDGVTYTNTTGVFANLTPNTYQVTVRNSSGCVSTATPITINAQPPIPAAPTATPTQPTCTVATGTITVNTPAPAAGISYSIDGVTYTNTTGVFPNLTPNTYQVTVRNSSGCVSTATPITINAAPSLPAAPTATPTQPTCTVATGTITVNTPAPAAGISYSIDGVTYTNTTGVFANLTPNTYQVTVRNSSGCVSTATPITINAAPALPAAPTATPTQPTCTVATGTITVNTPAPAAGITYSIDGVTYTNTTGVFANLTPNTYQVTVRNSSGCVSTATPITINAAPAPPAAPTATPTQPTCTVATGTITVNTPAPAAGISYSIDGVTYTNTTGVFANLTPNTYQVTVRNSSGCVSTATPITINAAPSLPAAPTATPTQPTCTVATGTITVNTPAPAAGISYSIDGVTYTNTTGVFANLTPNTYQVTVRNSSGCVSTATPITINAAPAPPAAPTATPTQPTCTVATGTITVNTPAPAAGISYSIDGVTYTNTTGVFANLTPNTYQVTVRNSSGCVSTATPITINAAPAPPAAPTATPTQPTCTVATGTITVNTPAPAAGISYSIDGVTYTNTTGVFANLTPNTYQVTVRNSSGCVSTATPITINAAPAPPAAPTATPTQPTCTVATGTITVNTPAPAAGISYSIDGVDYTNTSGVFTSVAPGTYNVTVKNAAGCISSATSVTINAAPAAPAAPTATPTQPTCTVATGTITVNTPAPAAGISYSIDGVTYTNTTGVFANLTPNTYQVTVRNSSGCVSTATPITINTAPSLPAAPTATPTQPTCTVATGTITVNTPAPAAGISYSIDGVTYTNTTGVFANLTPATYQVTVRNSSGCVSTATPITINAAPSPPAAPTATATSPTSCAQSTGTITVNTPAPAAGITYSIDGVDYTNTTGVFTSVAPGTYNVTVKNSVGCISQPTQAVINAAPTAPAAPVATSTSPTTCSGTTGTITVSSPAPAAGISYSIDGVDYTNTSGVFTSVAPGTYNVTVKNAAGCISSATSVTINAAPAAPAAPTATPTQPTCTVATGTITVNTPAPAAGISYSIDGVTYTNTTGVFANLTPNTYQVTVRNSSGCVSTATPITINTAPSLPAAPTATPTQPTCTVATGTITVNTPAPAAGISYSIDGVTYTNTTGVFANLTPATYQVTVRNSSGCVSTATPITINAAPSPPAAPTATATSPTSCAQSTGTITVNTPAPAAGITYSIDGVDYTNTTGVFTSVAPGTYNVTVKNSVGCISQPTQAVINAAPTAPAAPVATSTSPTTCSGTTGTITVSSPAPAAGISYSIDGVDYTNTSGVFTSVAPGTYNVTVKNAAGCISSATSVTINAAPSAPAAPTATPTQPTCTVATGTITVNTPAPAAGITYSIDGVDYTNTSGVFTSVAPGTYNVTVKDAAGCISSATSVTIDAAPAAPAAPTATPTQPTCTVATGSITVNTPAPAAGITYSIDGVDYTNTTGVFTSVAPGTYNVTVKNAAGCISSATSVTIDAAPSGPAAPTATPTSPTSCAQSTGTITVNTPAPAAGISYSIDGVDYTNTTGVFTSVAPGTYNVTVKNAAGCISSATSVTINAAPSAPAAPTATPTQPTCTVATGTITVNTPAPAAGITYSIDGVDYTNTSGVFTSVAPGTYNVTVKNAAGCISSATSVTIDAAPSGPAAPTATPTSPTSCAQSTGTITVNTPAPAAGITYSIDGVDYTNTSGVFTNVAPGTYNVTVKDAAGCISSATSVTIDAAPAAPAAPTATPTQPTCTVATGSITVNTPAPAAGITYSIDGVDYTNTTGVFTSVAPGTYNVTVKNAAGCISSATSVTIDAAPSGPAAPTATPTSPTSCAQSTGTITVNTPAPAAGISYSIDGVDYTNTTGVFTNVAPGTYNVTVKNAAGCISSATSVTINAAPSAPAAPTATPTQPTCTVATGTITVNTPAPAAGISYSIDGVDYTNTSGVFTSVAPGTYNVTVKNAAGCISSATSVTIDAAPSGPAAPTATPTSPTSCAQSTGTITVNTPAPAAGITYSIDGVDYTNTSGVFTNVAPGTYNVTVKDSAGCISSATSVTIDAAPAAPAAPTATPTQPTCTVATGSITVNTPAPAAGITYSIDGVDYTNTTGVFTSVAPGTYNVTVKNAAGCISSATSVTIDAAPSGPAAPTATPTSPTSCAQSTGTITVNTPAPAAGISYSIDGVDYTNTTGVFTSVAPGTYNVTVKDATGCISSATSVTIDAAPLAPAAPTATPTQPTCTVATGTITVNTPAPAAGITYSIDGVDYTNTTGVFTSVAPGTYNLTVKNAAGCISSATSVTIDAAPSGPAAPTATPTSPTSCAQSTGTITVNTPVPAAGITYSIDGVDYTNTSGVFASVAPGTYNVTVKDAAGCISSATSVTIDAAPSAPAAPTATPTQPTCTVATGTITVNTPAPAAGITYSIDGVDYTNTTGVFTSVAPGTYNVTVKNAAGCISSATSVTIDAAPSGPASPTATPTSPTSCAQSTGTITVNTPAPAAGITYSIDGVDYTNTSGVFASVAPGTYNVTVKDATGCISSATSVTIDAAPSAPAAPTATPTQPTCTVATGSITVNTPAPAAGITYSIDGVDYTNTTGVFTSVAPGTYNVTVKNAAGCISSATSVTIDAAPSGPAAPTATPTSPTSCAQSTGTITVNTPVPAAGITYSIDGVDYTNTSGVFTNVAPGTYNVTVKDAAGCISPATSVTIDAAPSAPAAPTATPTSPTSCAQSTGTITINTPAPAAGITYSIDGVDYTNTSGIFTSVAQGTYNVTVKDGAGCISSATSVTINAAPSGPAAPTATPTSPTSCAQSTGTITVNTPVPAAGITYSIDGVDYTNTSGVFTNVAPGIYNVTVKDAGGCISPATSVTIDAAPSAPAAPIATSTSPTTCSVTTGSITVTSPLGPQYTYSIDGVDYTNTTGAFSSVAPGTYNVTVKNAAGCISSATSVTIDAAPSAPAAPTATPTSPTSCAQSTGTITVNTPAPAAGITYSIDGVDYTNTSGVFTNVAPGIYNVTVKDAAGCISPATSLTIDAAPSAPAAPIATSTSPTTCSVTTGSITVTSPLGPQYTYSIDGVDYTNTTGAFSSVAPGTYNVTVKNAAGCISSATSVTIDAAPSAPAAPTATPTSPTSCAQSTGTITVNTPAPAAGISYSIDGVDYTNTTGVFTSVAPGTYNVTVKDAAGCISQATSVTINAAPGAPAAPSVTPTSPTTCSTTTGIITVTSPSPVAGIHYSIDGVSYSNTTGVFSSVAPGVYNVTVKDAAGCISQATTITINAAPNAPAAPTATPTSPTTCAQSTGTITVNTPAPAAGITYSIDGVDYTNTTGVFTSVAPGTYNVTVKDAAGCISSATSITINAAPSAPAAPTATPASPTSCAQSTGTITVNTPAPAAGISYSIDGVDYTNTTGVFTSVAPGTYNVTVKDAAGCISSATSVTIDAAPSAPAAPTATPTSPNSCAQSTGTITVNTPAPAAGISYSIDGVDYTNTTGVFTSVAPGTYNVTVKDAAGCISSATPITINAAPSAPVAPTATPTQPTCTVATGTITVNTPAPAAGITYSIDGVDYTNTTGVFTSVAPGTYNVTVKDAAGCISSATPITINAAPSAPVAPTATPTQPTCTVATGTITVNTPAPAAGITYSIDGVDYTNTTGVFTSVAPGTYNVTVKDAAGCISSATPITINAAPSAPVAPTATPTQPTCTVATGTITVNTPAPAAGITYSIDGVDYTNTTGVFTSVAPGTYNVTVKDAAGCISSATPITINAAPSAPVAPTATPTQPTCTVATGTITVNTPAPAAGISYSIDGVDYTNTTGVFTSVAPGTYNVTVKDAAGCISSATPITINAAPSAPVAPTATPTQPTCTVATGTITVNTPAPAAGITYSIDGVDYTNTTGVFTSVAPGTYNVTVKDAAGCISSATPITINAAPSAPVAPTATPTQPTCTVATGTITVNTPAPAAGITYSIDGVDYTNTTGVFTSVAPGTYNVTVKDAAGCISSATPITINAAPSAPVAPTATPTQPTCTVATGTITVNTPAPAAGITYSIDGVDYTNTTGVFTSVAPGTYNVTVKDAAGCISSATPITINAAPSAPVAPTATPTQPTCTVATGTITVNTPAPAAGITYSIDGVDYTNTTGVFTSVAPGTYNVTVKDAAGCISSATPITINAAPSAPVAPTATPTQPTCTVATGTITVNTPAPAAGITYSIDGVDYTNTTGVFTSVAPGTYNVTVKDAAGCISSATPITINAAPSAPVAPTATPTQPTCTVATGTITVNTPAPGAGISYSIDGVDYTNTTGVFTSVAPGNYNVTVKDAAGCISSATPITINAAPSAPVAPTATPTQPTCTVATGTITVNTPAPAAGITYSIDGVDYINTTGVFTSVAPGTYNVTVKDAAGCISSATPITINAAPSAPVAPTATPTQPTCTIATGTITVNTPAPGAGISYSIDGVNYTNTTGVFTSVAPGTYNVTVKDAAGCISSATPITINAAPSAPVAPTATIVDPTCSTATGSINVTAPLGAQYTYSIDGVNFQASVNFNNVSPNTYTLTVMDISGCVASSSITVAAAPSAPTVPTATIVDPTCSTITGSITVTAPLGAQYTYSIDGVNFQASVNFNNVSPNTYTLTVMDVSGCVASSSVTVATGPSIPIVPTATIVDPTCSTATGSITVTAPLGAQYTYSIDGVNFQASVSFINVSPNTYTLTVKDVSSCVASSSVTVAAAPGAPAVPTATIVDPTCSTATGSITVTAPLGAQYTYSIDGVNFQASVNFNNVSPNTYTLIVKDINGCVASSTLTVAVAPSVPIVPTATVVDPTCLTATGSITVTAPLGAQFTYSIDGANFQASINFNNVSPNTYSLTVKDVSGCVASSSVTVAAAPNAPSVPTVSIEDPICGNVTGTITVTTPLGAQYTYSLDGVNFQTSTVFSAVPPNNYTLTVKETGGCVASSSVTVNPSPGAPTVPTATVVDPTCSIATGSITVTAPLGAQYTYSIDGVNFQASPLFSAVSPNSYSLTVNQTGGCVASSSVTINPAPNAPAVPTATVVDPTCSIATGSITVTTPLGPQYTYSIDGVNFQASVNFNNVSSNSYTLTVKETGGCVASSSITVNPVPSLPIVPMVTVVDPTCSTATGSITVDAPLGAQYSYSIDGVNFQASVNFNNVTTNTYTLTVKDVSGCVASSSVTVAAAPSAPTVPTATIVDPTCSTATGSITVTAPLGAQYTYSIDGVNFQASVNFNNVSPNPYTLTVMDASGCVASSSVTVAAGPSIPIVPAATIVDPTCSTSGSITVTAPLGAQYTYSIDGVNFQASVNFNNVSPNTYTLTVMDLSGCVASSSVTVAAAPGAPTVPTATVVDPTCSTAKGSITVTTPLGAQYTYSIDGVNFQASVNFNNVSANTYTLTVKETSGCVASSSVTVAAAPGAPTVPTATVVDPTCSTATGSITVTAPLGAQYTYSIDGVNFQASENFNNVSANTYTLTVMDVSGCVASSSVTVAAAPGVPTVPAATIVDPTCSTATGSITVTAPLGAQYTYSIDGVNFQASVNFNNVSANTYTLTVMDVSGCVASSSVTVAAAPSTPTVPTATIVDPTCSTAIGSITITAPMGAQYTYSIDGVNFQASVNFINVSPNTYTLTVMDVSGCVASSSVTVAAAPSVPAVPTATIADPTCSTATGSITVTAPLGAQYTYSIDGVNFQASVNFTNVSTNTYTLTVKETNGCVATSSVTVAATPSAPTVPTATVVDPTCSTATGSITVTTPLGAQYTYSIDGVNFQALVNFNNVSANTYTLTVKETSGCVASSSVTVAAIPSVPTVPTATVVDPTCSTATGSITVTAPLGAQYTYSIDGVNFQASVNFTNVSANTYTLTAKETNGCVASSSVTVAAAPSAPTVPTASIVDPTCSTATGSMTVTAPLGAQYTYSIDGVNFQASVSFNNVSANTYTLTVKELSGCVASSSVTINPAASAPLLMITDPAPVCEPAIVDLTTSSITAGSDAGLTYTYWNDNAATNALSNANAISTPGIYFIQGKSSAGCVTIKPVSVSIQPKTIGIRYPNMTTTSNVSLPLLARTIGNNDSYQWAPPDGLNFTNIKNPLFRYDQTKEYIITITSGIGCITVDTLLINVNDQAPGIGSNVFVPTAWTPNADGHNDYLFPLTINITKLNYFRIFNRWGQKVFETNIMGKGWDGVFKGNPQVSDSYTWTVEAVSVDGKTYKYSGRAVLIR